MKKIVLLLLNLFVCTILFAQKSYTLTFDKNDYSFTENNGILSISNTANVDVFYSDSVGTPVLPYSPYCILRPARSISSDYSVKMEKELIYEHVNVEATKEFFLTSDSKVTNVATCSVDVPVIFGGDQWRGRYYYAYFKVSPFVYDAVTKRLYFVNKLTITLPDKVESGKQTVFDYVNDIPEEKIMNMVVNPEELAVFYPDKLKQKTKKQLVRTSEVVDYLIVTSPDLADAYQELADWKIRKGLRAKVLTTDELYQHWWSGSSNEIKIKNCLYDYYLYHDTKWVLLGGDASIIPSLNCRIRQIDPLSNDPNWYTTTPTDLFYACFGGCFDWDFNGNNVYGEYVDQIDLTPNIKVARVPSRTVSDVSNFVAKEKYYEMNPPCDKPYNILFAAASTDGNNYKYGTETMISQYVYSYHVIFNDKLYYNESNITGYSGISVGSFSDLINSNYNIVHVNSHGSSGCWKLSSSSPVNYTSTNAIQQTNSHPSVILSSSCYTNNFDNNYNCIGRSLLCAPNAAVAVWGSSREGFCGSGGAFGASQKYDGIFFRTLLFDTAPDATNIYGELAANTKENLISEACSGSDNNASFYRSLMFSINPLGDPEMPIYTNYASSIVVGLVGDGYNLTVDTHGTTGCKIAVTSYDHGESFFHVINNSSTDVYTFTNINKPFYITVSKNGYKPFVSDLLYPLSPIQGSSIVNVTETYSLPDSIPSEFELRWRLEDEPSGVYGFMNNDHTEFTVRNWSNVPMQAKVVAVIGKGIYYKATSTKNIQTPGSKGNSTAFDVEINNAGTQLKIYIGSEYKSKREAKNEDCYEVSIYKADSGTVTYDDIITNQANIDISNWKSGIYIVKVTSGSETVVKKLTK